jgi:hypothetical protein
LQDEINNKMSVTAEEIRQAKKFLENKKYLLKKLNQDCLQLYLKNLISNLMIY